MDLKEIEVEFLDDSVGINMNVNEFDILSMQFRCDNSLGVDILHEYLLQLAGQENVYNTSTVLIDEASSLVDTVYAMCRNYQKVIEKVRNQQGSIYLYITHHTQKERELVIPSELLRFLAEREISMGVD